MEIPEPHPGLVIRYSYLWAHEHRRGQEEGIKDRPCAVVLATQSEQGQTVATVVAVTHTPTTDPAKAVEIPAAVKVSLGLDEARSWIIVDEVNQFIWPGPDLRPATPAKPAFGVLPPRFFRRVRDQLVTNYNLSNVDVVGRTQ